MALPSPAVFQAHQAIKLSLSMQVKFIKIDAEAHELYILAGARTLLEEAPPPMILMEYFPKQVLEHAG